MLKAAEAIIALKDDRIGGIYFEGPFLSPERKGAQPEQWLVTPSIDRYRELYAKTKGRMRILALAPELPGAKEIIHQALSDNVIPALAHSNASYEEAMEAIDQGVRHFTHLYNGMRVFHHRDPGAVAAALLRQEVTVELIADGIHVHPAVLKTVIKLKGIENICLITDSISAAGMKDGSYFFSGQEIIVERGIARLATGDSLAGSTLTLDKAIRNLLEWGVSLPHAIKMASSTPARVLGIQHSKGSITPGKDADLVIFDQDLKVRAVFVRGRLVYNELEEASLALGGDQ
jgi:N-acetylglucosamine-6-phosphate deacetylase